MTSTEKCGPRGVGGGLLLLLCLSLLVAAPVKAQTDSSSQAGSTKEKLLRLLGDTPAQGSDAVRPAAKPASPATPPPSRPRQDPPPDRTVSPVPSGNAVVSATSTPEPTSGEQKAAAASAVSTPKPPDATSGSYSTWWLVLAAVLVATILWYVLLGRKKAVGKRLAGMSARLGLNSLRFRLIFMTVGMIVLADGSHELCCVRPGICEHRRRCCG